MLLFLNVHSVFYDITQTNQPNVFIKGQNQSKSEQNKPSGSAFFRCHAEILKVISRNLFSVAASYII